jgi:hypothetical protein
MPSSGPIVFAGPPSVIAQISLESEAFRIAALSPARAAVSTRPTGSPAPGSAPPNAPVRAPAQPAPTGTHGCQEVGRCLNHGDS